MQKRTVILGAHYHLPQHLEKQEFDHIYQNEIKPFATSLYNHPELPVSFFFSGTVLERLESGYPEFIMLLKELAARKQAEFLTGGYYNPSLPAIPIPDRIGQIELLTTKLRKTFGRRPRGCWLANGNWEQPLASSLKTAGIDFVFIDQAQFRLAGLDPGRPYVTEDQGKALMAVSAGQSFQQGLPGDVSSALQLIGDQLGHGNGLLSLLLPGDSIFGPSQVGAKKPSVEELLTRLSAMVSTIDFSLPGRYLKNWVEGSLAYFPPGLSRGQLLPNKAAQRLYARMCYTQGLVNQFRGDKARKKMAKECIYMAQDTFAYDYPPRLSLANDLGKISGTAFLARSQAYKSILEAERLTRSGVNFLASIHQIDYDFDGQGEIVYQGGEYNAFVSLRGGSIVDLESTSIQANLLCTEYAHDNGLFRDYFFEPDKKKSEVQAFEPLYKLEEISRGPFDIKLCYEGALSLGAVERPIRMCKFYSFNRDGILCRVIVQNIGHKEISCVYRASVLIAGPGRLGQAEGAGLSYGLKNGGEEIDAGTATISAKNVVRFVLGSARAKQSLAFCPKPEAGLTSQCSLDNQAFCHTRRLELDWNLNLEPGKEQECSCSITFQNKK